jgi:hypothetical protein
MRLPKSEIGIFDRPPSIASFRSKEIARAEENPREEGVGHGYVEGEIGRKIISMAH